MSVVEAGQHMAAAMKTDPHDRTGPRPMLIGELLQSAGILTDEDVVMVIAAQRERGLRFGEAAMALGLLKLEDLNRSLSRQFEYPYVRLGESGLDPALYVAYAPFSPQAEAVRNLRSRLMLHWGPESNKTLAVVGARRGAGCSRVAANLAIAFSQLGDRTLLIDANLRAPRQHQLFGLNMVEGLSEILGGRSSLQQAIMPVPAFPHLSVLGAGVGVPNPQELVTRREFSYLMQTLPASFDVLIVDAPPMLEFADAQLISAQVRSCLLVTRQHASRMADVETVKEQLQVAGVKLIGAVINTN
jgi:receptor protein-tyrosine kinase